MFYISIICVYFQLFVILIVALVYVIGLISVFAKMDGIVPAVDSLLQVF